MRPHPHPAWRTLAWTAPLAMLLPLSVTAAPAKGPLRVHRDNPRYFTDGSKGADGDQGIYVGVMLFQGWSIYSHDYGNPWPLHPFNKANNVNGVNGDADADGSGKEAPGKWATDPTSPPATRRSGRHLCGRRASINRSTS